MTSEYVPSPIGPRVVTGGAIIHEVDELLRLPGVRLVMPDEETDDFMGGLRYQRRFDRVNSSGPSVELPDHRIGATTYSRVFANDIAEPYMKNERLRFPAGSIIVREKLIHPAEKTPFLVSVMIKGERGSRPSTNDWEFFVVERSSIVNRGKDVASCVACHTNTRATDFVYKTYLTPEQK